MLGVSGASTLASVGGNRPIGWLWRLHRIPGGNILVVFIAIQIGCVAAGLAFPAHFRYLSSANISVMLQAIPTLGFIALGVGALMIAGEFDLSVGSVYTFTSIVAATLLNDFSLPAWIDLAAAVALGAAIGVANGLITLGFGLPSFIVTLGAMLFWRGMILLLHGALSIGFQPDPAFQSVFGGAIGLLPMSFIWLALFCVCFHVMMQHRRLGNHMFAVGGNRDAAYAIGIRPTQVKLIAFGLAGGMAALSGVFSATRVNSITPVGGAGLELQAIAACVIGGLSLTGGRGSILGIFLGAALTYTIQDVLLLMRAPGFYLDIFVGALIVGAAILNQIARQGGKA